LARRVFSFGVSFRCAHAVRNIDGVRTNFVPNS
jgi:hypothetical protein